jgi:hypothetical protein
MQILYNGLPRFWVGYYLSPPNKLMKAMGSHDSSSLLFVMQVMVSHFVSNSHKVMSQLQIVVVEIFLQFCGHIFWQVPVACRIPAASNSSDDHEKAFVVW